MHKGQYVDPGVAEREVKVAKAWETAKTKLGTKRAKMPSPAAQNFTAVSTPDTIQSKQYEIVYKMESLRLQ